MNNLVDASSIESCSVQELGLGISDHWSQIQKTANFKGERHALLLGDATKVLRKLPDGSINTCLTSPPYWSVRDYEADEQIGLEDSVDDYVERIVKVFREVKRTLTSDGTAWLNIGDCYINGAKAGDPTWKRNKQLALVPFRVAIALENDGWLVRNTVVWHKPNAMPSSASDRLTNAWEPIFLLAKNERYFFNLDAVRVPHKTEDHIERRRAMEGNAEGKAKGKDELRRWLNSPRHRATIDGLKEVRRRPNAPLATELAAYLRAAAEREGIAIKEVAKILNQPFERVRHYFRTDEIGARRPPEETWGTLKELLSLDSRYDEAMAVEVGDNVFRNHPNGRNPGDVQSFSLTGGATDAKGHFAVMPPSLASWCLQASLPPGGVCLDPFLGIGTTGLAALAQGGRIVGVDVREDYLELAAKQYVTNPSGRGRQKG
ncbi:site-specific DNA-methyltransferase [Vogesella sp. DC21W]|uniref:Methyltransferase n=1 Tax=Vogesella aquatica TaxID=2984206 RepID=A0ABT5ITV0_9NEIS|nr:site-specific DNA-methyltransferase [Vogesella aquatica]MDC7715987.1 site-specific DNA-methyltransferase [Vogesella aquatica]